jgi:hypothetical protein
LRIRSKPKPLLNTDPSINNYSIFESCPSKEPPPPALARYLVIELIDLDPVIGINVSSLLENCCDAPVFPLLNTPFDLAKNTYFFNAFDLFNNINS